MQHNIIIQRAVVFLSICLVLAMLMVLIWKTHPQNEAELPLAAANVSEPFFEVSNLTEPLLTEPQQTEPQAAQLEGFEERTNVLPFELAEFEYIEEYRHFPTLDSWKLSSDLACAEYAMALLESLQSQGFELIEAGYMDLSGECWGCVLRSADGESLSVMLIPERPFSPRSSANRLVVTILRYLQPQGIDLQIGDAL